MRCPKLTSAVGSVLPEIARKSLDPPGCRRRYVPLRHRASPAPGESWGVFFTSEMAVSAYVREKLTVGLYFPSERSTRALRWHPSFGCAQRCALNGAGLGFQQSALHAASIPRSPSVLDGAKGGRGKGSLGPRACFHGAGRLKAFQDTVLAFALDSGSSDGHELHWPWPGYARLGRGARFRVRWPARPRGARGSCACLGRLQAVRAL